MIFHYIYNEREKRYFIIYIYIMKGKMIFHVCFKVSLLLLHLYKCLPTRQTFPYNYICNINHNVQVASSSC